MKKIKMLLLEKDITALQMSRDLGINPSTLSMYVGGWRRMPDSIIKDVADYLNVEAKELYEEVNGVT